MPDSLELSKRKLFSFNFCLAILLLSSRCSLSTQPLLTAPAPASSA